MPNCIDWIGNASYSYQRAQEAFKTVLDSTDLTSIFPKIRIPEVSVASVNDSSKIYKVYGLRYAYNSYPANKKSYIYYAQIGKNSCMGQDASVDIRSTEWMAHSSNSFTGAHITGGDYTANNSTYCMRVVQY